MISNKKIKSPEEYAELFKAIAQQSNQCIGIATDAGQYVFVNPAFCNLMGYSEDELLQRTVFDLKAAKGKKSKNAFNKSKSSSSSTIIEVELKRKDGSTFLSEVSGSAIKLNGEKLVLGFVRDITQQKMAEQELYLSNEKFKAIFEGSSDALMLVNKNGFIDCNNTTLSMFGFETKAEFIKSHPATISPPKQADGQSSFEKSMAKLDQAFKNGVSHFNWIHQRQNGELFSADVLLTSFAYQGGQIIQGTVRDLSESIKFKRQLDDANSIINSSPAVAFLWKHQADWPVEYVSENVGNLFEYSVREFLSGDLSYSQVIHPDDLELVATEVAHFGSLKDCSNFIHTPYRIITKYKRIKWIEDRTNIIRNENGDISHYQGIILDITDRIESDQEIRKLSRALEQSPNSILITDKDGIIEYVNPAFTAITGYAENEAIGRNPKFLKSGKIKKEVYKELWHTIISKNVWHGELINRTKSGEIYHQLTSIAPVFDESGEVVNYVGYQQDISKTSLKSH